MADSALPAPSSTTFGTQSSRNGGEFIAGAWLKSFAIAAFLFSTVLEFQSRSTAISSDHLNRYKELLRARRIDPNLKWGGYGTTAEARAGGSPFYTHTGFRGRNDDGDETTATWIADADTNYTVPVNTIFRHRIEIKNDGGTATTTLQLEANRNGGSFFDVTGSSSDMQAASSGNVTNDDPTTEQLAGPGTFEAGKICEADGLVASQTYTAARETEHEFVLIGTTAGTYVLRCRDTGGNDAPATTVGTVTIQDSELPPNAEGQCGWINPIFGGVLSLLPRLFAIPQLKAYSAIDFKRFQRA